MQVKLTLLEQSIPALGSDTWFAMLVTKKNGTRRMSDEIVKALYAKHKNLREVGRMLGVSHEQVRKIIKGTASRRPAEYKKGVVTIDKVIAQQPEWFSRANIEFFGDRNYRVLKGKKSGDFFLVRSTTGWVDMVHFRINYLNDELLVSEMVDEIFEDMAAVKKWLKEH